MLSILGCVLLLFNAVVVIVSLDTDGTSKEEGDLVMSLIRVQVVAQGMAGDIVDVGAVRGGASGSTFNGWSRRVARPSPQHGLIAR